MAAAISFPFCLDPQQQPERSLFLNTHFVKPSQTHFFTPPTPKPAPPFLFHHKFDRFNCTPSSSSSHSSTETSPSSSSESSSSFKSSESYLIEPLRTGRFLGSQELEKLQILENFRYFHEYESGSLSVRVMRQEEMDMTVGLLSESFGESMSLPFQYVNLLAYLIKQYMVEKRALMPHTATLVGYYREGDLEEELAGTVEISFDKKGANASPPSPTPPKNSPYICNMTVKKSLRRRGIGWHLLKACEELISQMSTSREVYLHCRMIDAAPFNMYTKAGYNVIKTDNILILLTLQRRKHLMCKKLPVSSSTSMSDISSFSNNFDTSSTSEVNISSLDDNLESNSIVESDNSSFNDILGSSNTSTSEISSLGSNLGSNSMSEIDISSYDDNLGSSDTSTLNISSFGSNLGSSSMPEAYISSSDDKFGSNNTLESDISSFDDRLRSNTKLESDNSSFDDNLTSMAKE